MALSLRWVGESDYEAVARARQQSYALAGHDWDRFRDSTTNDPRVKAGDFLLAESGRRAVGTATSISLTMWVAGAALPCQGVGYVGTIHTARRSAGTRARKHAAGESAAAPIAPGIASQVMAATLDRARERGEVVSALMPFRASFYEHFGYGLVERRHDWTVPISILPHGDTEGFRFYEPGDFEALVRCRQGIAQQGQCDIERSAAMWRTYLGRPDVPWYIVDVEDAPDPGGSPRIRSWLTLARVQENGKDYARIGEMGYDSIASLIRQLHFLATLRDQYFAARLTLPVDVPLNRLLRESQVPHRLVNHATAECRPYTRMQLRILDHRRFLESLRLPPSGHGIRGKVDLIVHECDGPPSRLRLDISEGRIAVSAAGKVTSATAASASGASMTGAPVPAFTCADHVWASIACGDLRAVDALRCGLAAGDAAVAELLAALAHGPSPFTLEYF